MKHLTFVMAFAAVLSLAFTNPVEKAAAYKVDVKGSTVKWTAYKVTGKHFGKISLKTGSIEMSKTKLSKASFEVDMTTLTVEDITGEYADKLKGHLVSDDFFSVEKHKTAKFVSTKIVPNGKGGFSVTGDLTIKGITKPITFDAAVKNEGGKIVGTSAIKVDRTNYDIKYGSGKFFQGLGDKAIYDEFDLEVSLVASK
ncbi:YceI family protein [Haliscomenobacter sp.]|uniref:YceI family protein n=1 Tax=Haliscomenobacter sp. TaxID=2717303 RepID=UPI0035934AA2